MIYNIDNIEAFTTDMLGGLHRWLDSMVGALCDGNRMPLALAPYLKRGINNAMIRYDAKLQSYIDTATMFIADENGNINVKDVISDVLSMLDVMEEREFSFPFGTMSVGKGSVIFKPSESILTNLLLGNVDSIKMTGREIADMLFGHLITDDV